MYKKNIFIVYAALALAGAWLGGCAMVRPVVRMITYKRPENPMQRRQYQMELLASPDQCREYLALPDSAAKERYWHRFWKAKDPTPTTERNERFEEHQRRVAYADRNFRSMAYYWDDRGKIYIKYGEPDEREAYAMGQSPTDKWYAQMDTVSTKRANLAGRVSATRPWEHWTYYTMGKEFYFVELRIGYQLTRNFQEAADANYTNPGASRAVNMEQPGLATEPPGDAYKHDFGRALDFPFGVCRFAAAKGAEVWVYYSVPLARIGFDDSTGLGLLFRNVVVMDRDLREVGRDEEILRPRRVEDPATIRESQAVDVCRFLLQPGEYTIAISVEDMESGRIGIYKVPMEVIDYQKGVEETSDLLIAADIQSDSAEGRFRRGEYRLVPQASHSFRAGSPVYVYFEVYNLKPGPDSLCQAEVTYSMVSKKSERSTTTEPARLESRQRTIDRAVALPTEGLMPGDYILLAEVRDLVSGKMRSLTRKFNLF